MMELRSDQTMTYLCDVKDVKRGLMRGEAIRIQATQCGCVMSYFQ